MTRTRQIGREALLWIGGALGTLCLLSLVAGWAFNVTPLVFASGSMSPTYDAGALGIAQEVPAADLEIGDVVSVVNSKGDRVTHRIVGLQDKGGSSTLRLKGDTNDVVDAELYNVRSADRVVAGVPLAGYAVNAAASPFGLFVAALVAMAALFIGFGSRRDEPQGASPARARLLVPAGLVSAVALGGVVGATGLAPWAFTSAYWTDTATATTTATTPAPVTHAQPVCTSVQGSGQNKQEAKLTWPALGLQYEYYWELWKGTSPGGTLYSSNTIGPAVAPTPINLMFGIVSGGGGNDSYYAKVWTRLVSDHSNVGSPTLTLLHSGPRPNGPNWWMYCGPA